MSAPDPARRQRQAAHILALVLRENPHLPVITWTVTPTALHGHADLCDVNPGRDRQVFTAWAAALDLAEHPDPEPDPRGPARLRAARNVAGLPVVLTATVHPF
jgi:hypothetical protein